MNKDKQNTQQSNTTSLPIPEKVVYIHNQEAQDKLFDEHPWSLK